ncbi:uncharacterized protein PV09_00577 [Verruconis gallopava]|uniref:Uncharacterized protein n=1 Tax=Verruconis gallopava TaxID=253628 RepID=A0A0D2AQ43_9PEZI|nr:uncharacterized protein PV09_00577 [Verruconis gallopava]KIW08620.1 hypothetical protein PV09_00577 [Verruconis gallopava]
MAVDLPYTLHSRYASIAIAWTVILVPPIFLNLGLFYGLWYGRPELDRLFVLTLPTAILGIFTALAVVERVWKLVRPSPEYRPLNAPRYALDVFQWGYFVVLVSIASLITSTLARDDEDHDGHEFQIRLMSLPAAVLMYLVATLTFVSLILNYLEVRLPFRFGSLDAGNVLRPAVYYIVEDVVAVDGGGGIEYRKAFGARYNDSPAFRAMIWNVSVAWMVYFYACAAAFTALIFTLPKMSVYAVGWAGPFPLAGLMAVWTIFYVKSALQRERDEHVAHESTPLLR